MFNRKKPQSGARSSASKPRGRDGGATPQPGQNPLARRFLGDAEPDTVDLAEPGRFHALPRDEADEPATRETGGDAAPDTDTRRAMVTLDAATGKLLTDILAGVLGLHSKSAPKYGSEKSGAPTNFYITLSPEPIKITNAELEAVEIVVSPDHKVFSHANPLLGLGEDGTLIMQSHHTPLEVWKELPAYARKIIREKRIKLYIVDAFGVAKKHAPAPELEIRMMGIAFIGAICGHVDRIVAGGSQQSILEKVEQQVTKKFGAKGQAIVDSNMKVVREGLDATSMIDYSTEEFKDAEKLVPVASGPGVEISAAMARASGNTLTNGLFDQTYYNDTLADRIKDGTIGEAPVMPGSGLFRGQTTCDIGQAAGLGGQVVGQGAHPVGEIGDFRRYDEDRRVF